MQLSKRCEYGLRALIDIAVAQRLGRERVPLQDLAIYENIPRKFLEQILTQLCKAGYLKSKRGPQGGYSLSLEPKKVFFGDLVRLIDGPLAPIRCASKTAYERCNCPNETLCGLHLLMLDLREAIASVLDKTSLEQIMTRQMPKIKKSIGKFNLLEELL